jgi:hypothetical protein
MSQNYDIFAPGNMLSENSEPLALEETKNPRDKVDEDRKKAHDIVYAHFEETDKQLSKLKGEQKKVLSELNYV